MKKGDSVSMNIRPPTETEDDVGKLGRIPKWNHLFVPLFLFSLLVHYSMVFRPFVGKFAELFDSCLLALGLH